MKKKLTKSEASTITGKKKLVFNFLIVFLSFLLLFVLEFGLRQFNYGKDLSIFQKSDKYPGYYEINDDLTLRYFTKVGKTSPTSDIFLINKPDTCYRIFVFGGSTTRGFPYQEGTAFPRILHYRLQDVFPNKRIEVINLSASAINSYSYIDMANEVFKHKPDAILVYGGHNEYYGALGVGSVERGGNARWIKKLRLKLSNLRTFQMVENVIKTITTLGKPISKQSSLMARIVKDKDIPYNSSTFHSGIDQFKANLIELIEKSKSNKVPIILSDLVSNTKDQAPFKSINNEKTKSAIDVYNEAKKQEAIGNYDEANIFYYEAKDLDAIRFRAPEALNECIYELAKQYDLPLVQMKTHYENNSPNGLIGDNLMVDHLHPNIDGYFLMAEAFFSTLKSNLIIDTNWDDALIKPSQYYRNNWGFTALDSLIGDLNIKSLKSGWPFKPTNELNLFLKTYRYKGIIDSLAFNYLTSEVRHIEDEHIKLAQFYSKYGLYDRAFQEYNSLIKMHPYAGDLYFDASKYLIRLQKYDEALKLIESAPLINKNYYYYYMMGTLQLKTGDTIQSIISLNYSYNNMTADAKPTNILRPLYAAYRGINDSVNEARVLQLIQKHQPNFRPLPTKDNPIVKYKISIDELYELTLTTIKQGDYNKAIEMLLVADEHEENFKVKKLLASLYLQQGNDSAAFPYCRKAFEINPNDFDNLNNLFLLYMNTYDLDNALNILSQMESLNIDKNKTQSLRAFYNKKKSELE